MSIYEIELTFSAAPMQATVTALSTMAEQLTAERVETSIVTARPSTVMNEDGQYVEDGGTVWAMSIRFTGLTGAEVNVPLIQIADNDPAFITLEGRNV